MATTCCQPLLVLLLIIKQVANSCVTESLYPTNYCYNGDFELPAITSGNYLVATPGNLAGWTSTQSEIGKGPYYNSRWGTTQVIELATNSENTKYNQTLTLTVGVEYKLELQCAAKENKTLATSGFAISLNDIVILDQSTPTDYEIHTYSLRIIPTQVTNKLTLEARGTLDSSGTTCDNVKFRQIQDDYNVVQVNGSCVCNTGFYAVPPSPQCQPCSGVDTQCLICSNETNASLVYDFKCSKCSWGFYTDGASCQTCSSALNLCANCSMDGLTCYDCQVVTHLSLVNGVCVCDQGYYNNMGTCTTCASSEPMCLQCELNGTQFVCLECQDKFYEASAVCISCGFVHSDCLNCTAAGVCYECDSSGSWVVQNATCACALGFYENSSIQCTPCSTLDASCTTCQSSGGVGKCLGCLAGKFPINATCVLCSTTLDGCTQCDVTGTICSQCDTGNNWQLVNGTCACSAGYYQNVTSKLCLSCSNLDSLCLTCNEIAFVYSCLTCSSGFYPSGSSCLPCNTTLDGCTQCDVTGTICSQCANGGFWDLISGKCYCQSGYYLNLTLGLCVSCSNLDPFCTSCNESLSIYTCLACSKGYFPINASCVLCTTTLDGCQNCTTNGSVCTQCDDINHWELLNGSCYCQAGFYLNVSAVLCEACTYLDPNCELCSESMNVYQCLQCAWGYYPVGDSCVHCTASLTACLNCSQDATVCFSCNETTDYFLDSYNPAVTVFTTCTQCMLHECLDCDSLRDCQICNEADNFFLNVTSQLCQPCILEACLNCSTLYLCNQCDRDKNYLLNDVTLQCHVCTLEGCIRCSSNETCQLCGEGYKSQPNQDFLCDRILGCSDLLNSTSPSTTNPSVPAIQYTLQECQNTEKYKKVADAVGYASYGLLFLSLFSGKIVGLELFGVLQLTYFNLADHEFVNLYLSPFLNWRFMNGFNFEPKMLTKTQRTTNPKATKLGAMMVSGTEIMTTSSANVVPEKISAIGYSHSFLENMNMMLLVMFAEYLLSLFVILLSCKISKLSEIGYILLKEIFLTIFIFNCFNITFSAGLHFKYATAQNTENYALSTAAAISSVVFCFVALLSLELLNHNGYGQFKSKFKVNWVTRSYITVSILYRMALGFYMATGNEQDYQSLLILAISFTYLMYNIINLPFIDAYQNYRANLCHFTQLVILFVFNFYSSMKANESLEVKSRLFTPALLQISLILFCLLVSAICLFYEIVLFIKRKCGSKQVHNQKVMNKSQAQICKTDANDELYEENN